MSASLSGLAPATTYYYRLVASNGALAPGRDRHVATPSTAGRVGARVSVAHSIVR